MYGSLQSSRDANPHVAKGKKTSGRAERTARQHCDTLLTRWRRVSPTTMGQKPPPGLISAVKGAPQNHGATRFRLVNCLCC